MAILLKTYLTTDEYMNALHDLTTLIERQWVYWISFRSVLGIPANFTEAKMNEFISATKRELLIHLVPSADNLQIRSHKEEFGQKSDAFITELCTNLKLPTRSKKHSDLVHCYWSNVGPDLPCLLIVYSVLRVCAASEAQCERYFSSEAILHSSLRNRMAPDLIQAILNIRFNQKFIVERMQSLEKAKDAFIESDPEDSDSNIDIE